MVTGRGEDLIPADSSHSNQECVCQSASMIVSPDGSSYPFTGDQGDTALLENGVVPSKESLLQRDLIYRPFRSKEMRMPIVERDFPVGIRMDPLSWLHSVPDELDPDDLPFMERVLTFRDCSNGGSSRHRRQPAPFHHRVKHHHFTFQ